MHSDPNPALPPAGVRKIIEGIVAAVRVADSSRVRDLLEDLVQVADPAALMWLRSRLRDDLGPQAEQPVGERPERNAFSW
ncbi:hypothetical protein ACIGXA_39085 [Streptomyces fildesensis]|uniref:Uncharacterized protein n=1 Tax=Streptomyces fildesensis TaxID=375757 RepID=A0ABW8CJ96_9ACTN